MRIGIDLGGTKIEAIALDDDGRERLRRRIVAPRGDYEATLDARSSIWCDGIERDLGVRGTVGVGIPGMIASATGLVKNANSTWLNGRRIGDDLRSRLGRPVRFENDANCFALSEAADGAAAGARCRLRRDRRHRHRRRHRRATAACCAATTKSAANGDTTRCRRCATTNGPGHAVIADATGASKRSCQGQGSRAIMRRTAEKPLSAERDRGARHPPASRRQWRA